MSYVFRSSLERALLAADVELQHWAAAYPVAQAVRDVLDADFARPGWTDRATEVLAAAHALMSEPGFGDVASDMALLVVEGALYRPTTIHLS